MQLNYVAALAAAMLAATSQAAPLGDMALNRQVAAADSNDVASSPWPASGSGSSQATFSSSRRAASAQDKKKRNSLTGSVANLARRALGTDVHQEAERDVVGHADRSPQRRFGAARRDTAKCSAKSSSSSTSTKKSTSATSSTKTSANQAAATSTSSRGISKTKSGAGVVGGYYPSWVADTMPPENIYWPQFDYMSFAFANVGNGKITIENSALLKRFVAAAHGGNTLAVLSVGGWGQSGGFSDAVVSDSARNTLATSIATVIKSYNLDGIDLDWEYPGNVDGGKSRGLDTKNFQTFLQLLRTKIPTKFISAAVPQQVWQGSNGDPVGSVARAAGALDYLMLMNYDVWGSSSTPGPNAPLANLCGNSTQPVASAAGGVKAWTNAGMPASKILLGVPSYGYINTSTKKSLRQRNVGAFETEEKEEWPLKVNEQHIQRRKNTLTSMDGTTGSGQINFNQLVAQGALKYDSDRDEYVQGDGWTKMWDDCSDTPYLTNSKFIITYDDPDSLYDKADFARIGKLAGVSMWSIDGDTSSRALFKGLIAGLKATS